MKNMNKVISVVLALMMIASLMTIGVSAQVFNPSYEKLLYETHTYALARSATYYYTDPGTITNGTTTKTCRGLQGRDIEGGYVSANGWINGLGGTHVEVYIYGQASNEGIYSDDNMNCNTSSDCSTAYSGSGRILTAASAFYVNDSCNNASSTGHTRNIAYSAWSDRIAF